VKRDIRKEKMEKIFSKVVWVDYSDLDKEILRGLGLEPDRNKRRMRKIRRIFNV
jgi:hypothetical protein